MAAGTSQEASSSSSVSPGPYHVFLSFRGEDTRKTFTDHLYTALVQAGFYTFRDDDEIERGENILSELKRAIRESKISIIVVSRDYASSRWCLNELVMILKRKRTSKHEVLPVFYDVDPSDVRKQTGPFAEPFARHERRLKREAGGLETVKTWREALTEVADLAAMNLQNQADGYEARFIQKIVSLVDNKLNLRVLGVPRFSVGIQSRVKSINTWLRNGCDDGMVAICGMGGIGKTTISKFVYNHNFGRFDGSCFLANIREVSKQPNGLARLQKQLLHDILKGKKEKIFNVDEGFVKIKDTISSKRVLLVLDDVDQVKQLDAILGTQDWFCPGSKIIITTRNEHLLKAPEVYMVYRPEELDSDESFELFSWHAFGQDHPFEGFSEYSKRVVHLCRGLPLALEVLGGSLYGRNIDVWESTLEKLQMIPDGEIFEKLKLSFDSLQDDHYREVFLHIACFFVGKDKGCIVKILNGCGFPTVVGIQHLSDRCLLTIDNFNKIMMHQLLRDMGREIVRQESPKELEKRSRLWHHEDSFTLLKEKIGSKTIEGLVLDMHAFKEVNSNEEVLEINALARMYALRLLQLCYVQLSGSYDEFPKRLRWLCWRGFPLESIPNDFPVESLVALDMRYSSLKQVWKGTKLLESLKILNLSHSHYLAETPDFSVLPSLERVILKDCTSLLEVHESIGNLVRLVFLNIKDCKNLRNLPQSITMSKSLQTLIISGCSKLQLSTVLRKLESLEEFVADGIDINQLLATTEEVKSRQAFDGSSDSVLTKSPDISWANSLPRFLVRLSLADCNLSDNAFPRAFSNLFSLQNLNLSRNPISILPNCIKGLTQLQTLQFESCKLLQSLVGLPSVKRLNVSDCGLLEKLTFQSFSTTSEISFAQCYNLVEFQPCFKIEPIPEVDTEIINILCLPDLASMENIELDFANSTLGAFRIKTCPIQGLHEYGLFSTFFPGREVPRWFIHTSMGSSMSVTVPRLPNLRVQGVNVCSVYALSNDEKDYKLPHPLFVKIRNKSKGLKWIYGPSCLGVPEIDGDMIWLCHWKLGNQLDDGDEVRVSVFVDVGFEVKECGINFVYEQEERQDPQENTSNTSHRGIIGGDLSEYEVMIGTYFLGGVITKVYDSSSSSWLEKLIGDSDETTGNDEGHRVGQLTVAAAGIDSNDGGRHCQGHEGAHSCCGLFYFFRLLFCAEERRDRP